VEEKRTRLEETIRKNKENEEKHEEEHTFIF
jgi:hypothetical protein